MKSTLLLLTMLASPFAGAVEISIQDGTVRLSGVAASLDEMERAVARASSDPAATQIINEVVIPRGESDKILKRKALEALGNQTLLQAERVKVSVSKGRAVLTGEIGSFDENELARELVSRVPGIVEIENRIEIVFDSIRTDAQIGGQIEFMVADDPSYENAAISVHVTDGIVRLSGEIGSRELWEDLVGKCYVTGVFAVEAHELSINGRPGNSVAALDP